MAKSNGALPGIELPETSLAKKNAGPAEGSKEWMAALVAEHGDTAEEKLQQRRERLSALTVLVDRGLKRMQAQKKAYIASNNEQQRVLLTALEKLKKDGKDGDKDFDALSERIASVQLERYQQEAYFENLITQTTVQLAMVEGQCLIVDSVTLREEVTSKSGKTGHVRYSSALIQDAIAGDIYRVYRRLRKVHDLLIRVFPETAPLADDDDEGRDEADVRDEDIATPEERKAIRRQVEEEA